MKDRYKRRIDYIRISLTDRCNLRCIYCMPEDGIEQVKHSEILTYEQLLELAVALVKLGITSFKLTGGEPLVRIGVTDFIKRLKGIPGVENVTITTNGILLQKMARELVEVGIDGINISMDTLDPERYKKLTRIGDLDSLLESIELLKSLKYDRLKLNCVPIYPDGRDDIIKMAEMAVNYPLAVRFIEIMPIGEGTGYRGYSSTEILDILESEFGKSKSYSFKMGNGPANYVSFENFQGKIGFIDAVNDRFCDSCNRIRLSSTGFLKLCLHHNTGEEIKSLLGIGLNPEELANRIGEIIMGKPKEHGFGENPETADKIRMHSIGG